MNIVWDEESETWSVENQAGEKFTITVALRMGGQESVRLTRDRDQLTVPRRLSLHEALAMVWRHGHDEIEG